MAEPKVFFVALRRPKGPSKNPNEQRDDPFWEFGSFGCTGCHSSSLFNPRHAAELEGARLAFVQGGRHGSRLAFLTPPISVKVWENNCEARWTPAAKPSEMPFKYKEAPMLVSNHGQSDFPLVKEFAQQAKGPTIEHCLCSKIRTLAKPLEPMLAHHVVTVYERLREAAPESAFASAYHDALPYPPPRIDRDREATYQRRISELARESDGAGSSSSAGVPASGDETRSTCRSSPCGWARRRTGPCT